MTATTHHRAGDDRPAHEDPRHPQRSPDGGGPGDEDGFRGVVHHAVAARAARRPGATAVRMAGGGGPRLTYAGLERRSNRIAHHLLTAGVRPGDVVGVNLERSVDMVATLLAILKCGAAYLALDLRYPASRRRDVLADAGARAVVTWTALAGDLAGRHRTVLLDGEDEAIGRCPPTTPEVRAESGDVAYVAYTSGSTGKPKGTPVPHAGVTRLVVEPDYLDIAEDDVFLLFAPLAFDASTLEIWGALCNGCTLVVQPPGEPSLRELAAGVAAEGVTILWLTAGLFHQMADGPVAAMTSLRALLAGGDVLSPAHAERVLAALPGVRLVNGYGPTENTTFTCCGTVRAPVESPLPVGRAIRGTRVYVLDDDLEPVPDGAVGELYAAGSGVALGYLNRPALTAERFLPDPYTAHPGRRMYRTGDLVRRRPDGVIDFLGRADKQLKIRGFRIEPGEVEAVFTADEAVADAVVVGQSSPGGKVLAAFVVPVPGRTPDLVRLRAELSDRLPSYAVPGSVTLLDSLPLTANGKVDRAELERSRTRQRPDDLDAPLRLPDDPLGRQLTSLWQEVLGVEGIGVDDDFFQLGGNSLLAVRIVEQVNSAHAVELTMRQFYLAPTVAGLAATVAGHDPSEEE
ncbi:non-ribosomal peptide synthetase [Streptomyces californicus]|uniref:non-ribosomal peptide synthetase n=1 Tax=Streptomyces californicus TaxID=67351 RepID=UPI0037B4C9A1